MSEIRKWLDGIALGQNADAFEANDIEVDLLGQLDDQFLKTSGFRAPGIGCEFVTQQRSWFG